MTACWETLKRKILRKLQSRVSYLLTYLRYQERCYEIQAVMDKGLVSIGRHTYGQARIWSYQGSEAKVTIGPFCSISPGVAIITGGIHPVHWVSSYPFRAKWGMQGGYLDGMPETRGPVVIGPDVWLGTDVLILSGVTIGPGAILAARSVVTKDVPPYAVAAGSPARVLKYRFDPATIEKMLQIAWWQWDDNAIREAVPLLSSANMEAFIETYCKAGDA